MVKKFTPQIQHEPSRDEGNEVDTGIEANIVGKSAEEIVEEELARTPEKSGDRKRAKALREKWENSRVPSRKGKKRERAANVPDNLELDPQGRIKAVIEVKAVKGDHEYHLRQIASVRDAWRAAEEEVRQLTGQDHIYFLDDAAHSESAWGERIEGAFPSRREKILRQVRHHAERLEELVEAGELEVSDKVKMVVYVSQGEDFGEWPKAIDTNKGHYELEVRFLKPLSELHNEALSEKESRVAGPKVQKSEAFAATLRERQEVMRKLFEEIPGGTLREKEEKLALAIIGNGLKRVRDDGAIETIDPSYEGITLLLEKLHTNAPSIIGVVLYTAAGGKLPGLSKAQQKLARESNFPKEVYGAIVKLKNYLTRRGWKEVK